MCHLQAVLVNLSSNIRDEEALRNEQHRANQCQAEVDEHREDDR